VAWAPDLGGRVPVDAAVRDALAGVPDLVVGLGGELEGACPDLDEADEVFTVLRSWLFAASLGPVIDAHPELVKATIHGNVAAGRRLSGADLAHAEAAHTRLHVAVAEFFTRYDVLLAPTTQVVPFDVATEYPTVVDGITQPDYLGWMRSCTLLSATGLPILSLPAAWTPEGLPRRPADRRTPAGRPAGARGGPCAGARARGSMRVWRACTATTVTARSWPRAPNSPTPPAAVPWRRGWRPRSSAASSSTWRATSAWASSARSREGPC